MATHPIGPQPPAFTTRDVVERTGVSARQLDYWAWEQILVPSLQQAHGRGTRRLYSLEDLLQVRFIKQLLRKHWSIQKIRKAISILRAVLQDPDPLKNAVVIADRGMILALCKTKEGQRIILDALNSGGQGAMAIILTTLLEDVPNNRPPQEVESKSLSQAGRKKAAIG